MATTPGSPVMQGLKNFWQRPEGTVGKVVLVLGGIAAAYGWAILVFLFIVTDKRVRTLAKLMFQSIMRYLTGLFIELDPIGILKNYIGEMKKNLAVMDEQLGNLNGSIRTLQNQIDTNQKDAEHSMALANQADKKMAAGGLTSEDSLRPAHSLARHGGVPGHRQGEPRQRRRDAAEGSEKSLLRVPGGEKDFPGRSGGQPDLRPDAGIPGG